MKKKKLLSHPVRSKQALRAVTMAIFMAILWTGNSYANTVIASGTLTIINTATYPTGWFPTGDVQVYGKLEIDAGVTVNMEPYAKITVEKDGRLKANGVTFTLSYPNTNHWYGIEILGDPTIPHQPSLSDADNMVIGTYTGSGGTTDQKGAASLKYCTIEKCNYGTVLGQIDESSGTPVIKFSGSGGATLDEYFDVYKYIDYVGICLVPFNGKSTNQSSITWDTIYNNYSNTNFMCIALFGVNMANDALGFNRFVNKKLINDYVLSLFPITQYGLYSQESGFTLDNCTTIGFLYGVKIIDVQNSFSKTISNCSFYSNWWDIVANATYNVSILSNYSVKDLSSYGGSPAGQANVAFTKISGDNFYTDANLILLDDDNASNADPQQIPIAILFSDASTPLGKITYENTISLYERGIQSDYNNYGMSIECNDFEGDHYDVVVTNAGVLSEQGSPIEGDDNYFHAGCSGQSSWLQNPGVADVRYWYNDDGDDPHCHSASVTNANYQAGYGYVIGEIDCVGPAVGSPYLNGSNGNKASLAAIEDSISGLPSSPSLMTSRQISLYKSFCNRRDYFLGKTIKLYIDAGFYDSAFYIMNEYPCQRANLDKINLLITLDSSYASYSTLITNISNGFSLCSDGSGYCDDIYYDSILSA